jgi:hypothetical protein
MVGLRQQQPEGSRDLLYAISETLERKRDPCHKRVREVADICVDFGSWFHPYLPGTRQSGDGDIGAESAESWQLGTASVGVGPS